MGSLTDIKLFLFDMDGTLYLGNTLYGFTKDLLHKIRVSGRKYLFITNNSSKSVDDYVRKLAAMGISATEDDFVTSAQATAYYLQKNYLRSRLFVCGTESLKDEFRKSGLTVSDNGQNADCIVMGFDTELTFQKLQTVSFLLCTRQIPYIATNGDYVCPTEFGSVPDCGSVCDMVYNATGKRPVVIGKPSPLIAELAMEKAGCGPEQTAVIGDRIYTDILCGKNAGCLSVLVMSGETTTEILQASAVKPDLVLPDAGSILPYLE